MTHKEAIAQILQTTENMALATSTQDMPNVRVVTFAYNANHPNSVFFTTFKGNQKIVEFEQNENVAILPLPESVDTPAQVRIFGKIRKSSLPLEEVDRMITAKAPHFAETLAQGGPMLEPYEVVFDKAAVTIGMEDAVMIDI